MVRANRGLERKKQERQMLSAKVKKPPLPLPSDLKAARRALRSVRPARINCRWNIPSLTDGPHHDRGSHATARMPSSRHGNRGAVAGGHVRLPTPPTTRAAAAPEKARPWRETIVATASIKWPSPLLSKEDPRVARTPGSNKYDPRRVQISTSGLEARLKQTGAAGTLVSRELVISGSGADTIRDPQNLQMRKTGAPSRHPARPY
jgi:hypothetical protein